MSLPLEIERIVDDIRREIETRGAELVEIQFRRAGGRGCLTILADKPAGISLDDCAEINRALGTLFDQMGEGGQEAPAALRGAYVLEVSSPGLDRLLKTEQDFQRVKGGRIKIVWREADGRVLDGRGQLEDVADGVLKIVRDPKGDRLDIPLHAVVKAVRDIKI